MKKRVLYSIIILFFGVVIGRFSYLDFNKDEVDAKTMQKKSVETISMLLETEYGSGNYEMTTRESWPTEGYTFNSDLSVCERGSELSWDDENKRVLMSGNTSDKCYVYFDALKKTIIFYINDVEFTAEENMTWKEWINSSYNTDNICSLECEKYVRCTNVGGNLPYYLFRVESVLADDLVINYEKYTHKSSGAPEPSQSPC